MLNQSTLFNEELLWEKFTWIGRTQDLKVETPFKFAVRRSDRQPQTGFWPSQLSHLCIHPNKIDECAQLWSALNNSYNYCCWRLICHDFTWSLSNILLSSRGREGTHWEVHGEFKMRFSKRKGQWFPVFNMNYPAHKLHHDDNSWHWQQCSQWFQTFSLGSQIKSTSA